MSLTGTSIISINGMEDILKALNSVVIPKALQLEIVAALNKQFSDKFSFQVCAGVFSVEYK